MSLRTARLALIGALILLVAGAVGSTVVQVQADRVAARGAAYTAVQQQASAASGEAAAALRRDAGVRAGEHGDRLVAEAVRLERATPAGDVLVATVVGAARRMRDGIRAQEALLATNETERATAILLEEVAPAHDRLQRAVIDAHARHLREATRAASRADRLSAVVLALLLGFGALGVPVWLRLRRRADVAAFARTRARTFEALTRNASDVVCVLGEDGVITVQAGATAAVLGHAPQELVGRSFAALVHPDDRALVPTLVASGCVEWRLEHARGTWVHAETRVTDLRGDPNVAGLVLTTRDITERKAQEQRLRHQAFHDPLTQLPNRALFFDRLTEAARHEGTGPDAVAVLFVDVDDFKVVNDALGHTAGDALLTLVARRLESAARPGDTVARLGGDEFGILLLSGDGRKDAVRVAERALALLAEPLEVAGTEVRVAVSIGVATGAGDRLDADGLLHAADMAMYAAKRAGKNRLAVSADVGAPEGQEPALVA